MLSKLAEYTKCQCFQGIISYYGSINIALLGLKSGYAVQIKNQASDCSKQQNPFIYQLFSRAFRLIWTRVMKHYKTYEFEIQGMDCVDCASHIQKAVSKLKGVTKAHISFGTSKLLVETTAKV